MLFRKEGPRVAVVGPDNKVQLRPITIGRDYGATLEVLGGVSPDERVIVNPADSLDDGQVVKVASDNDEGKHS
jgi:multidrug efflux pump subunit AcrA (membrane-fusion protein)